MKTIEQIALEELRSGFGCRQNDEADHVQFAKSVLEAYLAEHSEPYGFVREVRPGEWKFSKTCSWGPEVWKPVFLAPHPAVPAGWKIVPIEPTDEMYASCSIERLAQAYWTRMLAASPEVGK